MLNIIKYYIVHRNGVPFLLAVLIYFLFRGVIFDDSFSTPFIVFAILIPYLDMFSVSKNQPFIRSVDSSLPLSFNKVWLAKSICLALYLIFLIGISMLDLFYLWAGSVADITSFTYLVLLLLMGFFIYGKIRFYKKGRPQVIGIIVLSVVLFFWVIVGVLWLPFALSPMENFALYNVISFVLPIAFINVLDYYISRSKWLSSLRTQL